MARLQQAPVALAAGRGSSLVELLLASLLFLVAVLAAAPLFMRAVLDVRAGAARSAASVLAQNRLEATTPLPMGAPAGAASTLEYYSFERRRWQAAPPAPPDRALWVRETTRRRYALAAIADGRLVPAESVPSSRCRSAATRVVCLMGVEVKVSRRAGGRPIARLERLEWTNG